MERSNVSTTLRWQSGLMRAVIPLLSFLREYNWKAIGKGSIMKLPNGDRAVISMEKLRGYCLNPEHPSGKHKARVLASALGITAENAEDLRELIARAAIEGEVIQQESTEFGQLFKVDWAVPDHEQVILRTLWEVTLDYPHPRLVSAFIK